MQRRRRIPRLPLLVAALALAACGGASAPALPPLAIDPAAVSISGISSGAYMAHQAHLAFSDRLVGAALLAGGPYQCAGGALDTALKHCVAPEQPPDVAPLAQRARERAQAGTLAPLEGLAGDRVWVYHGALDTTVGEGVARASAAIYDTLDAGAQVATDFGRQAAHLFPTLDAGGDCSVVASPFLGRCGFDAAGEIFRQLHPERVATAAPVAAAAGELLRFDQAAFAVAGPAAQMGDVGLVYVPPQCKAGTCGLHVALHGCEQSVDKVGEAFARDAGYNRWADAASMVVLYPQVAASLVPLNPKGCWDWWGYTGADYDTRTGAQLQWLARVLAALGVKT
jgi:poly(3-hydroxybutyrate) depolymerase